MTLIIGQDDAVVVNDVILEDSPALIITGDNVHLTNTEAGRIRSSSAGSPAIRIDGAGATIVNDFGAIIRGTDYDKPAIIGSAFADTIINEGLISGTISLGEGNDRFVQRAAGTSALIDFGGGDDIYEMGAGNGYFAQNATGGSGVDKILLSGAIGQLDGTYVTGFERLEIGAGPVNIQNFSGLQEVVLTGGGWVNMIHMANPDSDLMLIGASGIMNLGTAFRNVIGSDAAEGIDISSGSTLSGDVTLGGGDDYLSLSWVGGAAGPVFDGAADGGAGQDQISLNVDDGRTVDVSAFVNFERLAINVYTNNGGDVRVTGATGITFINTGGGARLTLAASYLPLATVRMGYPSSLTLEAGTTVLRIGLFEGPFVDPGSVTQADDTLSATVINGGSVLGDIRFFAGDDLYDGRLGTVGGTVSGYAGNDRLYAGAGNDRLYGGLGTDILEGGVGNDQLNGEGGNDVLVGGAGADLMVGGTGNDVYYFDDSGDQLSEFSGQGNDRVAALISLALAADADIERIEAVNLTGTEAMDLTGSAIANIIYGNDGVNILRGEAGNDELRGFGGNDFLVGGAGTDLMVGGLGDDTFYVDDASDAIGEIAGQGNDRIAASVSFVLSNGADVEVLEAVNVAATTAFDLTGSDSANTITGNAGANILKGEGGSDILSGAGGNDYLVGGAGVDVMNGGTGNDTYYVDAAGDVVNEFAGEGAADRVVAAASYALSADADVELLETATQSGTNAIDLTGSSLANMINGNDGANVLDGKGGSDTLTGFGGADIFQFTTALGAANVDTILGFVTGSDKIALDDAVFTQIGGPGALSANAFFAGTGAHDADDRIIYNQATGALLYDADGNGAGAAVQFATLSGGPTLLASDFLVI